jgi:heme oxygenase
VGTSSSRASGVTLAVIRRATAADHESVDALIDRVRLVEIEYHAAVVRGLIASAEIVESALPRIPQGMRSEELSPSDVSKRAAIDAESSFVDELVGPQPVRRRRPSGDERSLEPGPLERGTVLGLLYVYVGSALDGLHLLRVARAAPPERLVHRLPRCPDQPRNVFLGGVGSHPLDTVLLNPELRSHPSAPSPPPRPSQIRVSTFRRQNVVRGDVCAASQDPYSEGFMTDRPAASLIPPEPVPRRSERPWRARHVVESTHERHVPRAGRREVRLAHDVQA